MCEDWQKPMKLFAPPVRRTASRTTSVTDLRISSNVEQQVVDSSSSILGAAAGTAPPSRTTNGLYGVKFRGNVGAPMFTGAREAPPPPMFMPPVSMVLPPPGTSPGGAAAGRKIPIRGQETRLLSGALPFRFVQDKGGSAGSAASESADAPAGAAAPVRRGGAGGSATTTQQAPARRSAGQQRAVLSTASSASASSRSSESGILFEQPRPEVFRVQHPSLKDFLVGRMSSSASARSIGPKAPEEDHSGRNSMSPRASSVLNVRSSNAGPGPSAGLGPTIGVMKRNSGIVGKRNSGIIISRKEGPFTRPDGSTVIHGGKLSLSGGGGVKSSVSSPSAGEEDWGTAISASVAAAATSKAAGINIPPPMSSTATVGVSVPMGGIQFPAQQPRGWANTQKLASVGIMPNTAGKMMPVLHTPMMPTRVGACSTLPPGAAAAPGGSVEQGTHTQQGSKTATQHGGTSTTQTHHGVAGVSFHRASPQVPPAGAPGAPATGSVKSSATGQNSGTTPAVSVASAAAAVPQHPQGLPPPQGFFHANAAAVAAPKRRSR